MQDAAEQVSEARPMSMDLGRPMSIDMMPGDSSPSMGGMPMWTPPADGLNMWAQPNNLVLTPPAVPQRGQRGGVGEQTRKCARTARGTDFGY